MSKKGKLELLVGCMYAGKSTALLSQGVRHSLAGQKLLYIKPQIDNRYSDSEIVTHDGIKVQAVTVAQNEWLGDVEGLTDADVILIDEVQFLSETDVEDIELMVNSFDKTVYCAGLDMDFRGVPFPVTAHLMAVADEVTKLKAICEDCGGEATHSLRLTAGDEVVVLGSKDIYRPVCRKCYKNYI